MIIAALDTSFGVSFALTSVSETEVKMLSTVTLNETRGALQKLPELVQEGLVNAQLELADIDRWVIGTGPGSFTGIRIGIAFVKGICLPTETPFMGVPTILALAKQAKKIEPGFETFGVCFDGRRQELIYSGVTLTQIAISQSEAEVKTQPDFATMLKKNDAIVTLHNEVVSELLPTAKIIAFESVAAEELVNSAMLTDFAVTSEEMEVSCEPIYVRPAVFTNPLFIRKI